MEMCSSVATLICASPSSSSSSSSGRPSTSSFKRPLSLSSPLASPLSNVKAFASRDSPSSSTSSSSSSFSLQDFAAKVSSRTALRSAALWAMNAAWALPAMAAEVAKEVEEKGKIFDFNLTLPIIAGEFLLLMVALDNIWFKPVSKVMDDRDEAIRQKLMGVRDNSDEIKKLQQEAEAIIKAARAETTAELNKMKRETAAALDQKLQESRERIEKELADALANLEVQKQETLKSLDKQVQELSEEIIAKVIPFKI